MSVSLVAVLVVVGFLVVVAANGREGARRETQSRHQSLVRLIRERQTDVDQLGARAVRLRSEVLAVRRRLSDQSASEARRMRATEMRAGTLPMRGRGVEVVLSDSTRKARRPSEQGALSVHDVDLQLVVNTLWGVGAEAIAINGQRLVATSPIRAAGETITVNFRPLVPPYRVQAIGAEEDRFNRSSQARKFRQWVDEFGLGFSVKGRDRIEVPAYVGTLELSAAHKAEAEEAPVQPVADIARSDVPRASRGR